MNGISTTTNVNPSSTSILEVSSSSSGARKKFSGTPVFLEININSSSDGATILIQQPFQLNLIALMMNLFHLCFCIFES